MYKISELAQEKISDYLSGNDMVINCTIDNCPESGEVKPHVRVYFEVSAENSSFIRMETWLPIHWNGIFAGIGNGGLAGIMQIPELISMNNRDFAVITTDMGTSKCVEIGIEEGIENPAVHRDFGYRATHLMTEMGKVIVKLAYGQAPEYSVFAGGSTGGEQALSEAQRYPYDYDAILCGAPANDRIRLHTYFLWNFVHLRDAEKKPLFDKETVHNIAKEAIDFLGDFTAIPKGDSETVSVFVNRVAEKLSLSKEQEAALLAVYSGPVNPRTKERIFYGIPIGSEMNNSAIANISPVSTLPNLFYPFYWGLGEQFDPFSFDFDKDFERVQEVLSSEMDATSDDLSPFFQHGGKLLMIVGGADPIIPYLETLKYCQKVAKRLDKTILDHQFKFYIAPFANHCIADFVPEFVTADDGRDLLDILVDWLIHERTPGLLRINSHVYGVAEMQTCQIQPVCLGGSVG